MKKIIIWTVAVILGLSLGVWLWSERQGLPVEQALPSGPLAYASLNNAQKHVDQVLDSEFGKNIAAIDLPEVLNRNNFSAKDISDFKQWQDNLQKFWANPLMKKFLSKQAAVAFYQQKDGYKVYIVLRLTLSTRMAEAFSQMYNHWGKDVSISRRRYLGHTINEISFKGQDFRLAYVRLRDLVILSPQPADSIQDVIDVYRHKRPSLAMDPAYNFVRRSAYAKGDGLAFINPAQPSAFPVYGISYLPGVVSKYKMVVGEDERYIPSGMRKVLDCPALSNDTLRLVPFNAIAYNWSGCYDAQQVWRAAKRRMARNPEIAGSLTRFKDHLERHFHIDIKKDILPLLGHEIGGYLTDVDMQSAVPFPLPRLLIFVKIQDRPAAERLLDKLAASTDLHQEEYDSIKIHYMSLPMVANMDPGYCFLGDYLLAATSRQLLKRSIEAYNDSFHSIVSDNVINQFSLGQDQKFNSVTLMKTAELSRRAQDFLGWMDRYLSDRVTLAAAYQQDGNNKKLQLDEAIADKSAELVLARKKLDQLRSTSLTAVSLDSQDRVDGAIKNLSREEQAIKDDIITYTQQKEDLSKVLDNYASGAQLAKLTMYNMDNLVSPLLKGLESINAQAVTVRFGNKVWETELLVK
ncbi:MAG: DUF3352 domain-containing protein [Candidatus Omnitrophica bacterium]|nr:DUF3352 domain-containing protein [Candidatus Omnitrophota bacterium]MDE2223145.1 DUF3352 domain-containing protein [Candidatus Omnitrophota bacterium]